MSAPVSALARALLRAVRGLLLGVAALVMAIEEWGWRPLTALAARIARWPPLAALETRIRAASPGVALALFLVPAVLLFPLKVFALWLIHQGRASLGVGVIVLAKGVGTACLGRLFILTEPQLVRFAWFARTLAWWRATKDRVRALLQRWPAWQAARRAVRQAAVWVRRHLRRVR